MFVNSLDNLPRQEFELFLPNGLWRVRIVRLLNNDIIDLSLEDKPIVIGQRFENKKAILVYRHQRLHGNFYIVGGNGARVDFTAQPKLIYTTPKEA